MSTRFGFPLNQSRGRVRSKCSSFCAAASAGGLRVPYVGGLFRIFAGRWWLRCIKEISGSCALMNIAIVEVQVVVKEIPWSRRGDDSFMFCYLEFAPRDVFPLAFC